MDNNVKYTVVMVLSFMFGGFLLVTYAFMAYSIIWDTGGVPLAPLEYRNETRNDFNMSDDHDRRQPREVPGMPPFIPRRVLARNNMNPLEILISPFMMFALVGGLISLAAAISIWTLTHKRALKKMKEDLKELYLTDEEKKVMAKLGESVEEMTQRELTERMRFSRVKTHRILQRLETKKLIRKIPCGQTYKIVVEDKT